MSRLLPNRGRESSATSLQTPLLIDAANEQPGEPAMDALCAVNAALPAITAATEPNWIKLAPYGEHSFWQMTPAGPKVAGVQVMDREAANSMVGAYNSLSGRVGRLFTGLPIFVGHPDHPQVGDDYPDKNPYGDIGALEARDDGLYGRASWTDAGRGMVNEQQFRYPTPYWKMTPIPGRKGAFRPVRLKSLGLTNNPNISPEAGNAPLGAQNAAPENQATKSPTELTDMQRTDLIKRLGLAEAATDEDINAKLVQLDADAKAKAAAEAAKTKAEGDVTAANSARVAAETARNEIVLTSAVNDGRITAAQKPDWAGRLSTDFAANSKALSDLKPALNMQARVKDLGNRRGEIALGGTEIEAINEAVDAHMKDTGEKDRHKAFVAVKAKKPELFTEPVAANA